MTSGPLPGWCPRSGRNIAPDVRPDHRMNEPICNTRGHHPAVRSRPGSTCAVPTITPETGEQFLRKSVLSFVDARPIRNALISGFERCET